MAATALVKTGSTDEMKLPADTLIAPAKIEHYLLIWRPEDDTSAYLSQGGYGIGNADKLTQDLRLQILPLEAVFLESDKYGDYYEIAGPLVGPNGRTLDVRTIWLTDRLSNVTKFVTLIPDRRKKR